MQNFTKNVVFVLALVAAGFLAAWLRFRPYLEGAGQYTDGQETYDVRWTNGVRHAIWDPPQELAGEVNTKESESSPALSPDGRFLVFCVGTSDEESDLWIADLVGGVTFDPRPLSALNTAAGESAPAFSEGYLYFASNRAGSKGGFDLYRAPLAGGIFGAAEPVPGPVNTTANEWDPAPQFDDAALVFSSDRAFEGRKALRSDADLYRFDYADSQLAALTNLNSEFEDRDAALARNGSALFFASDRRGDFDLYRSAFGPGEETSKFLFPRRLAALSDEFPQRDPAPSADGFRLQYSVEVGPEDRDLFVANSRELYRKPGRPVGWMELAILAALLLLALLAKLSTRWSGLEILYKCLLVSLLVHLLLLWWFQHLYPESEPVELESDGSRIRVHLLGDPSRSIARNRERAGQVEAARSSRQDEQLARADLGALEFAEASAASLELAAAAAPKATAPERDSAATEASLELRDASSSAAREVEVRQAEAPRTERTQGVPELAMGRAELELARQATESGELTREVVPREASAAAEPRIARFERESFEFSAPRPERLTSAPESARESVTRTDSPSLPLAGPTLETSGVAERSAAAQEIALGDQLQFSVERERSALERTSSEVTDTSIALPTTHALEGLAVQRNDEAPRPQRARDVNEPSAKERSERSVAVQAPAVFERIDRSAKSTPAALPLATLDTPSFQREKRPARPTIAPLEFDAPRRKERDSPTFEPLSAPEAAPAVAQVSPKEDWEHTPYQSRSGEAKLRALEEYGGSVETERAVAAGLAYLAERQRSSGNWGRPYREKKYLETTIGKTGLAMLAFMGAGHTQESRSEYSEVVERAIAFLLEQQDDDTGHFGFSGAYSHAIATYALAECYALTGDPRLRGPLEFAVAHIQRHQIESSDERLDGGWGYYYPDGRTIDRWPRASVTVWQVMALESARLGELHVDSEVFVNAKRFLAKCWDRRRGAFRYSHDPGRLSSGYPILPGSTPASMFALSLLGEDLNHAQFGPARTYVLERSPRRYFPSHNDMFVERADGNLYFWYYSTLALFRAGGSAWEEWNQSMKSTLLQAQDHDGSWPAASPYSRDFAGDTDRDRCYSTAMCVLTLEVYYRYFTPLLKVE